LQYPLTALPFDCQELIGSLAPRFCFVSAPLGDSNFKWQSVDEVTGAARKVFELHRAGDRLQVEHPDCAHLFPPEMQEKAFGLLERVLK
jgi:hypothetical protein